MGWRGGASQYWEWQSCQHFSLIKILPVRKEKSFLLVVLGIDPGALRLALNH